jgi:hypothetical protein
MQNFYKKPKIVKPKVVKPKQDDFFKYFSDPTPLKDPKVFQQFSENVYNKMKNGLKTKDSDYHFDKFPNYESWEKDFLGQGGDSTSYYEELIGAFAIPQNKRGEKIYEDFEGNFQGSTSRDKLGNYLRKMYLKDAKEAYGRYKGK